MEFLLLYIAGNCAGALWQAGWEGRLRGEWCMYGWVLCCPPEAVITLLIWLYPNIKQRSPWVLLGSVVTNAENKNSVPQGKSFHSIASLTGLCTEGTSELNGRGVASSPIAGLDLSKMSISPGIKPHPIMQCKASCLSGEAALTGNGP